jgi:hypothetical protein
MEHLQDAESMSVYAVTEPSHKMYKIDWNFTVKCAFLMTNNYRLTITETSLELKHVKLN